MKKLLLLVFLFSFQAFSKTGNSFSNYENRKTISQGRYIVGGVAGIFPGFGIGHAIQGRYSDRGWIFTTGSVLIPVSFYMTIFFGTASGYQPDNKFLLSATYASLGLIFIGMGIKIWEMVDVWLLPSHYKITKKSPVQIKPLAFYDSNKQFHYGLSFNYQF